MSPDEEGRAVRQAAKAERAARRAAALLDPPANLPADADGWETHAACRDHPADRWRFHADTSFDDIAVPLGICAACPVRAECATAAIDRDEWGIWGGLTREQRAELRRNWLYPCRDCGARVIESSYPWYCPDCRHARARATANAAASVQHGYPSRPEYYSAMYGRVTA